MGTSASSAPYDVSSSGPSCTTAFSILLQARVAVAYRERTFRTAGNDPVAYLHNHRLSSLLIFELLALLQMRWIVQQNCELTEQEHTQPSHHTEDGNECTCSLASCAVGDNRREANAARWSSGLYTIREPPTSSQYAELTLASTTPTSSRLPATLTSHVVRSSDDVLVLALPPPDRSAGSITCVA